MGGGTHTYHNVGVEVRGYPGGVSSLLPTCGSQMVRFGSKHLCPLGHLKQASGFGFFFFFIPGPQIVINNTFASSAAFLHS